MKEHLLVLWGKGLGLQLKAYLGGIQRQTDNLDKFREGGETGMRNNRDEVVVFSQAQITSHWRRSRHLYVDQCSLIEDRCPNGLKIVV